MTSRTRAGAWVFVVVLASLLPFARVGRAGGTDMLLFPDRYLHSIAQDRSALLDEETVYFTGSRGENVPATLFRPRSASALAPAPALIVQYGISGNRRSEYIVFHAARLALAGYVTIVVDGPGRGDRAPLPPGQTAFDHVAGYIQDYSAALSVLTAFPYVDAERIGYVGISWGGISGITFAANEPRIKALVALGTGGRLPVLEARFDPIHHIGRLEGRGVMLINGRFDTIVNPLFSVALRRRAPADATKIWLNSGHYFLGVDQHWLNDTVIEFLGKALR